MKIVFENENTETIDTTFFRSFEECKSTIINKPSSLIPLRAYLFTFEIILSCSKLKELKTIFNSRNINLIAIYTHSRETSICANALKIKAYYELPSNKYNHINFKQTKSNTDYYHKGTIRSGNKISSNGNLFIIGDVNPGAQISAKKNIYVWGKLCGIAIAGKDGDDKSTISSLYLNPLQLRINTSLAIGPKEKPNDFYPEIALLEGGEIVIKPLLIK